MFYSLNEVPPISWYFNQQMYSKCFTGVCLRPLGVPHGSSNVSTSVFGAAEDPGDDHAVDEAVVHRQDERRLLDRPRHWATAEGDEVALHLPPAVAGLVAAAEHEAAERPVHAGAMNPLHLAATLVRRHGAPD